MAPHLPSPPGGETGSVDLWVHRFHEMLREHFRRAGPGSIRRTEEALGICKGSFRKWRLRGRLDLGILQLALAELGVDPMAFWLEAFGAGLDPVIVARRPTGPPRDPVVRRAIARWESPEPGPSTRLDEEELRRLDGLRDRDPKLGVRRAKAALKRAERRQIPRLLAIYGSGRRVEARLDQALEALRWALALAERGGASRSRRGNILQRIGVVFAYRGDHSMGLLFAWAAEREYKIAGDVAGEGRSLVDQGSRHAHMNQHEEAIGLFEAALRCLPKNEVGNRFSAYQCLATVHFRLGSHRQALDCVRQAEELAPEVGPRLNALLLVAKAAIMTAKGDHAEAERCYAAVLEIYRPLSPIDAALAAVDLARAQLRGGRVRAAVETAQGMLSFVDALENNKLADNAIRHLLRVALTGRGVTLELLDRVALALRKARARR